MQQQVPTAPASHSQIVPNPSNAYQTQVIQPSQMRVEAGNAVGVNEGPINEPAGYKSRLSRLDFNPCCCCTCSRGCCNLRVNCLTFSSVWLLSGVSAAYDLFTASGVPVAKIISATLWISTGITLMVGASMCIKNRRISATLCWISCGLNLLILVFNVILMVSNSNSGLGGSSLPSTSNPQQQQQLSDFLRGLEIIMWSIYFVLIFVLLYYSLCAFAMGIKVTKGSENEPAHGCSKMGDQPPLYGNQFPVYGGQFPYYGGAVPYYGQFPVYGGQFPLQHSQAQLQQQYQTQQSQQLQMQQQQQQQFQPGQSSQSK